MQPGRFVAGDEASFELHGRLGWDHDYAGGLKDVATLGVLTGTSFTAYGASPAKDAARLSLGAEAALSERLTVSLDARAQLAGQSQTYDGSLSVAYRW